MIAGVASAGGRSEQGSGTQSVPPRRIKRSKETSYPAVGMVAENRGLPSHSPDTGGEQEVMEAAEW